MTEGIFENLSIDSGDMSRRKVSLYFDLYTYYFDLVLRINTVYFTILGVLFTILSKDLSSCVGQTYLPYLLCLPCVLSFFQSIIYLRSSSLAVKIYKLKVPLFFPAAEVEAVQELVTTDETVCKSEESPHNPLLWALVGFGITHLLLFLGFAYSIYYLKVHSICQIIDASK